MLWQNIRGTLMERTWGFVVIEGLCVSETGMYTSPKGDSAISFVRQARRSSSGVWEQVANWLPAI